ncbi:MAG: hypothetical protein WA945_00250 [Arcobacteraceae bacterium]
MRNVIKISLVTALVLSTVANGAENIKEAFANSEVNGEIKAAYINSNFLGSKESDSVGALGGSLGIITDDIYGLKLGATFQASTVLNDGIDYTDQSPIPPFNVNGASAQVNPLNGSGSVLSELYLEYTLSNTSLKIGRQYINTPLISSGIDGKSSESILKDSFEAYVLTNTDIPDTTIVAAYINKYQSQTDGLGNVGEFEKFQDGAASIFIKNESIHDTTLQVQYLKENGITSATDKDVFYFQGDYKIDGHTLSAQYLKSTDKTQADKAQDGQVVGLKATGPMGIDKLGYLVAATSSTDKNGAAYTGAGAGTSDTLFSAMPVHGGGVPARADTDTIVGAVIVPTTIATIIPYAGKSFSSTHALGDVTAFGILGIVPFSKELLLKVEHEYVTCEELITENTNTTRLYLSYKF